MAIALDTNSNSGEQTSVSSVTYSHTTGTLTNGAIFVRTSTRGGAIGALTISSVTYNGVGLSLIRADTYSDVDAGQLRTEIWGLANPASGANNVVVTFGGTVTRTVVYTATYSGVDQSNLYESTGGNFAAGRASPISNSVTNLNAGAYVIDVVYSKTGGALTVGAGQTQDGQVAVNAGGDMTAASREGSIATPTSTAMSWTYATADDYVQSIAVVRAASTSLRLINVTTASGSSTTPTVNTPTNISGDLLVVVISHNDGTVTVSDNNGSTPCTESLDYDIFAGGAGGAGIAIYYRVLGGSEPSTFTFTLSTTQKWAMTAFTMRGQHTDVYDVSPTGSSNAATPGTTINSNSITTLTNNAWSIACGVIDSSTGTWNTGSPGGSWVEIATVNLQEPVKVAYLIQTTAGATGNIAFTPVASTNISALKQFAIKEALVLYQPRMGFLDHYNPGIF